MSRSATTSGRLKRYTNLAVALDMLRNRRISLVNPSLWTDRNDQFLIEQYRQQHGYRFAGAVCLTQASETFHHWKTFADGMDGICVEFDQTGLESCLHAPGPLQFGPVSYLRLDDVKALPPEQVKRLPFLKRAGYSDEREYRIIAFDRTVREMVEVPITLGCIGRVILSPFLPTNLANSVKATIRQIEGCDKLRVIKSHLINSATWQHNWARRLAAGDAP